jgi:ketosteroid isomerase-like protein
MPMTFDIHKYLEAFNSGDDEAAINEYFTEDAIVEGPDRTMHGREVWLKTLQFLHDGIRERLTLLVVAREGDTILAELDAEFTASKDSPDFLQGPLKAGESMTVRFFASYRLRDEKIARLALAWWPSMPNKN